MVVVLLAVVGLSSGCCRECEAPASDVPVVEQADQAATEAQLADLNKQMLTSSQALMDAEQEARTSDPEIGRLYDELVKGSMAYRKALEEHAVYAEAMQNNNEALEAYSTLAQKRDDLKKEISQ